MAKLPPSALAGEYPGDKHKMSDLKNKLQPDPPERMEGGASVRPIDHSALPSPLPGIPDPMGGMPSGPIDHSARPLQPTSDKSAPTGVDFFSGTIDHSARPPEPMPPPKPGPTVSGAIDHNAVVAILDALKTGTIRIRGSWDLEISIEEREDQATKSE